jgi:GT2 family glycosyltransferase
MNRIVVSVIVPTYRRPRQLQQCLTALASQSLRDPWEVIVVDDGSPEPPTLDRGSLPGNADWRLIRQANAGPSAARNRGVREARGEFVAFTDDDCRPQPTWLEALLRAAHERPGALVGGTTVNGLPSDCFASTSQLIVDLVYEHFNADPDDGYFLASNNILCPRERFLEVGGFDESFRRAGAEDRDFCDRWRIAGLPIVWLREAHVDHRHAQTFASFVGMHFRYGCGAFRYQAIRRQRGSGTMREDFGFHGTLPRRLWRRLAGGARVGTGIATLAGLGIWQAANASGFLWAAAMKLVAPRLPASWTDA